MGAAAIVVLPPTDTPHHNSFKAHTGTKVHRRPDLKRALVTLLLLLQLQRHAAHGPGHDRGLPELGEPRQRGRV